MKTALFLASFVLSLSAQAAPDVVRCQVTGPALYDTYKLRDLLVDDGGQRVIAIALGEKDGDRGTYNTYAHLNLGLTLALGQQTLSVTATSSTGSMVGVSRDANRPLWARVSLPSRLRGPNLLVELSCETVSPAYVLEPITPYNVDPVYGLSYLATTIPGYVASGAYSYPYQSQSEALAGSYCVAGSASAALADLQAQPSLWRMDVTEHRALVPTDFRVTTDGSIEWSQRAQALVCLKSHVEKQWNSDTGTEEEVTVCDLQEKRELSPVAVSIRACR